MDRLIKATAIFILLAASSAYAAPGSTLAQLRVAACDMAGVSSSGTSLIPLTFLNRRVQLRSIDVANDFPAVPTQDTIVTDETTRFYDLDSVLLKPRWCRKMYVDNTADPPDTGDISLAYIDDESSFQLLGGLLGSKRDGLDPSKPRYWSVFNNAVSFYPSPGVVDTYVVAYYTTPANQSIDASVTSIDPEYRQYVILLVAHDICVRMGDYRRAGYFGNAYERSRALFERERDEARQDKYLMEAK